MLTRSLKAGFANAVGGFEVAKGWKRIFQITFFVGKFDGPVCV